MCLRLCLYLNLDRSANIRPASRILGIPRIMAILGIPGITAPVHGAVSWVSWPHSPPPNVKA